MNSSPWRNLGLISLSAILIALGLVPLRDSDTFMYLAIAREFFLNGKWVIVDPFIVPLPGASLYVIHEWAGFLPFHFAYSVAGLAGLVVFKTLVGLLCWLPTFVAAKKADLQNSSGIHALLITGVLAFSFRFTERTALLADLLLVLTLVIVNSDWQARGRAFMALPFLVLVWANVHGSYPLGLGVIGIWLLAYLIARDFDGLRYRGVIGLVSFATPILNPGGLEGALYPFRFWRFKRQFLESLVTEWKPTFSPELLGLTEIWMFGFFLLLAAAYFMTLLSKGFDRSKWLVTIYFPLFTILGLSANRFVPTAVLTLSYLIVANPIRGMRRQVGRWMPAVSLVVLGWILSGRYVLAGLPHQFGLGIDSRVFPTITLTTLLQRPGRAPVWHSFYHGGYLAWALNGQRQIFVHGFTTDIAVLQRFYSGIGRSREDLDRAVRAYGLEEFLLARVPESAGLVRMLSEHPAWKLEAVDEASVLFVRRQP